MADALATEVDRVDELRATGARVLVAYGENDDAWSPPVQADMALRLDAVHAVIPDAAHSPAVENPDATVAVLAAFFSQ
jgi:pimeloyl-ACP methyl ester carboxylesterase